MGFLIRFAGIALLVASCIVSAESNNPAQALFDETRAAAERGDAAAQYNLGVMYATGEGVPEDDREAVKWYRKAAEQGDAYAQRNLGLMYAIGEGVPEDDREAVKWFRKAAEQGYAAAQTTLGLMYAIGEGVPEDYVQAYFWANVAGVSNETARELRDWIKTLMTPQQISEAQALSAGYFEQRK